jgi:DNA gyrase/topoisomerase IV subunit A
MFPLVDGEKITVILPIKAFSDDQTIFMATSRGTVKKTLLSDFSNPRKAGIIAVDLDEGVRALGRWRGTALSIGDAVLAQFEQRSEGPELFFTAATGTP